MSKALKRAERRFINGLPLERYCKLTNTMNGMRGRPHRLEALREDGLHKVSHGDESIVICRRSRHRLYKNGIKARTDRLADEYGLSSIPAPEGGVLIDCGANVGELGIWARANGLTYHAFEPEPLEADCVDINNFDGSPRTRRQALWHQTETLTFYSAPDSADSSAFESRRATTSWNVEAVRLDDTGITLSEEGPNILKLEAEGAEPEILDGATATLPKLHYIAVDCGYERGPEQRHTFIDVCDRLLPLGFRPIKAELRRITILFENTGLV
ncbi:FkbM family methyltransferase [Gymnodinialimonas ceratoperidinii]|uniref:FkbM family methyltransferase n=1 Tax=Gymnodinialimonas ceratoperidinii TaxID=2856823 RepID=A0A8F6TXQ9_9RHOB|nr:FkbM family methyltransferase [Gymnodinialimonas ceratoperidinii]QXT40393.1 FkbM family methyltransferase [Gymnodinialimonas ceratoperidinii]